MTHVPASSHGGGLPSQWTVDSHGVLTIQTDQVGGTVLVAEDQAGSGLYVTPNGQLEFDTTADGSLLVLSGNTTYLNFGQTRGFYFLGFNAAPADGVLAAGGCALWFDQTNGAAKLMVKAKQADGTVKTAAVALA